MLTPSLVVLLFCSVLLTVLFTLHLMTTAKAIGQGKRPRSKPKLRKRSKSKQKLNRKASRSSSKLNAKQVENDEKPLEQNNNNNPQHLLHHHPHHHHLRKSYSSSATSTSNQGCCHNCFSLCSIFCCPPWPETIINKIAFHPPPVSYRIDESQSSQRSVKRNATSPTQKVPVLRLLPSAGWKFGLQALARFQPFYVPVEGAVGGRIACVYVPGQSNARYTLLFSHGNAGDLGLLARVFHMFTTLTPVNIFSYDYHGYGTSSASPAPNEAVLVADIETAYGALVGRLGVSPRRIILYGESIGNVPTIDLAARLDGDHLAGVVLQSAFTSACRLFCPRLVKNSGDRECLGPFNSIDKVGAISVPVLVLHGTRDEVVPLEHGLALYRAAKSSTSRGNAMTTSCFIEGAGHNDMVGRNELYRRLEKFTRELEGIEVAAAAAAGGGGGGGGGGGQQGQGRPV